MRSFVVIQLCKGFVSHSTPSKEFEKKIIDGNLVHDGNPAVCWCVGNAIAEIDPAENKKPSKKKSNGRPDGVSATVTAGVGIAGL
ncbi:terminase large subunit [bacterium]|nr:terminase large subunit [bacterium]